MELEYLWDAQAEVGESPLWDQHRHCLWWVDILRGTLHRYTPGDGAVRHALIGQSLGFVVPYTADALVAGTRDGIGIIDSQGHFELVQPVELERVDFRMNDGKCDHQGRLWAGTMCDATHRDGRLYRIGPHWQVTCIREHLGVPNGLGWSGDGRLMYFADSERGTIEILAYDPQTGSVGSAVAVIRVPSTDGAPDGLTVDEEDCAWVCFWGGGKVRRYAPTGELLMEIAVPAPLTASCTFGGEQFDELFITTARYGMSAEELQRWPAAGAIFRCRPGVRGVPADAYRPA